MTTIDTTDEDGTVVAFKVPPNKDNPLLIKRRTYDECKHRQVEIDERERTLECMACHQKVDPITFLLEVAYRHRTLEYNLEKERDFLKREKDRREKDRARREAKRTRKEAL